MVEITGKLDGFAQVLRELGKVSPELRRESVKEMKAIAAPIVATARGMIPSSPPLSHWSPNGRYGFRPAAIRSTIKANFKARPSDTKETFTMLRIVMGSFSGAVYDMAGKTNGNTPSGYEMIKALRAGYGQPSRAMWKAAEIHKASFQAAVKQAVANTEQRLNDALRAV